MTGSLKARCVRSLTNFCPSDEAKRPSSSATAKSWRRASLLALLDPLMDLIGASKRQRLQKRPLQPSGAQLKQFQGEFS